MLKTAIGRPSMVRRFGTQFPGRSAGVVAARNLRLESGTDERTRLGAFRARQPGVDLARTFPGMTDRLDQRRRPQRKIAGREQVGLGRLGGVAA